MALRRHYYPVLEVKGGGDTSVRGKNKKRAGVNWERSLVMRKCNAANERVRLMSPCRECEDRWIFLERR